MLENVPLFSGLPKQALAEIEQHGSIKSCKKNVIVINQDDESYSLYVILSGSVKVFVSGEDGRAALNAIKHLLSLCDHPVTKGS